ncbi:hypothetical protein SCLCIDRAFT_1042082 [Scleroderma citrinum Foug A]|uniref:Ricin B lectin domain-containing protein n=1 Tax=Scleroderma citrinum Foug A TaxID=1036808 RepID=A0A0C3DSM9_9AGAM|nr:hypothetical protein SCLCIDRAFT_1042082 [Scleroderma citrinum Foug A]
MSNTLQISGDNYISTSSIYVGVNSSSQVVVNGAKTKFNFKYDSGSYTISYTDKSGTKYVQLDGPKPPPLHVIVGGAGQKWVINPVSGKPSTYSISPVSDPKHAWSDPGKGVNPRWIYDQENPDSTQPQLEFLISAN